MAATLIESIILGFLAVMGASCFAMSALGIALIFQIGYFLAGSLELLSDSESLTEANVYLTSLLLPIALYQCIRLWSHWNLQYVIYFGIVRAACTAAGSVPKRLSVILHFPLLKWITFQIQYKNASMNRNHDSHFQRHHLAGSCTGHFSVDFLCGLCFHSME